MQTLETIEVASSAGALKSPINPPKVRIAKSAPRGEWRISSAILLKLPNP
jgi:hypothetical protein